MVVAFDRKPTASMTMGGTPISTRNFSVGLTDRARKLNRFASWFPLHVIIPAIPRPTQCPDVLFSWRHRDAWSQHRTQWHQFSKRSSIRIPSNSSQPVPFMSCTFCSSPSFHGPIRPCAWACSLAQSMPHLFWTFRHSLFAAGIICLSLPFNELPLVLSCWA